MKHLIFSINQITKCNKDGSFATRHNRKGNLELAAKQLLEHGYQLKHAQQIKGKHIEYLVTRWISDGLSGGTIKNRMSSLRWLAGKINKPVIIAKSNDHYGIERREYVCKTSKAVTPESGQLAAIEKPHAKGSAILQTVFGLRREEAIKFQPDYAIQSDHIRLKGSWTKGGKPRTVPIKTEAQRKALAFVQQVAGNGSLIPSSMKYIQQRNSYEKAMSAIGIGNTHGLRHAYAQRRYQELTGWKAPVCGGPSRSGLSIEQRKADLAARKIVSKELGHVRERITVNYLGV